MFLLYYYTKLWLGVEGKGECVMKRNFFSFNNKRNNMFFYHLPKKKQSVVFDDLRTGRDRK